MKKLTLTAALILLASGAYAQSTPPAITQSIGTGQNTSYFVLNFDDGPGGADNPASDYEFAYHWNYNPDRSAPTSGEMIDALSSQTNPALTVAFDPTFSTPGNRFVQTFAYSSDSQTGYSNPDGTYGYWAYFVSNSQPAEASDWAYSGNGIDQTYLIPNSYDGFTFATDQQTLVPVLPQAAPEPTSWCLFTLGVGGITVLALRRKHSQPTT